MDPKLAPSHTHLYTYTHIGTLPLPLSLFLFEHSDRFIGEQLYMQWQQWWWEFNESNELGEWRKSKTKRVVRAHAECTCMARRNCIICMLRTSWVHAHCSYGMSRMCMHVQSRCKPVSVRGTFALCSTCFVYIAARLLVKTVVETTCARNVYDG